MTDEELKLHLDALLADLAEWVTLRGIATHDVVAMLTIAISVIINASCPSSHDRARSLDSVLRLLAARTGVAIKTRHLSDDGEKTVN